jgi:baseplate J-like protein
MPPAPPIAGPAYQDIAGRTERLAVALTRDPPPPPGEPAPPPSPSGWRPPADGSPDLGRALVRVFDRMARHVLERLNRVPDRSLLAFLDLVGVEPTPARPARAPLTFRLVERSSAEPVVPAGTRVGAAHVPGDAREIVFETAFELNTTRARLVAAFVRVPDGDRLADVGGAAAGGAPGFYEALGPGAAGASFAASPAEHALFVASDAIFGLPAGTPAELLVRFASAEACTRWHALHNAGALPPLAEDPYYQTHQPAPPLVRWSYWDGAVWAPLPIASAVVEGEKWRLKFALPAGGVAPLVLGGKKARWLRAGLSAWPRQPVPSFEGVSASATVNRAGLAPDAALSGGRPLDLSLDFLPFGERPAFNDALYVADDEALSRPGANVTLAVTLSARTPKLKQSDAPKLFFEVSTASGWKKLAETKATGQLESPPTPTSELANDVLRTTALGALPNDVAPVEVQGKRAHWLRIRLASGDFGKGFKVTPTGNPAQPISVSDDGYRPPVVEKLAFNYAQAPSDASPLCLTLDDRSWRERSASASFLPFTRSAVPQPALYLGFDRPFANRTASLFVEVAPLSADAARDENAAAGGPLRLAWEHSTPEGWAPLGVDDETRGLSRSGLVRFLGPPRFAPRAEFGEPWYWLRVRLDQGAPPSPAPRLGRVLTNTVWATHAAAVEGEVLGSADGSADQAFALAQRPVLEGQRVEVREPSPPPPAERAAIERREGEGAVVLGDDPARPDETWVRWTEVPDFRSSGPRDRHYQIDRPAGRVSFGDGRRGMAPPRGLRNVRATYRAGGGADGNRPAGALAELKTTVPYVEGVTNPLRAEGGADREGEASIRERGPRLLRHGGRAVTAEDVEDLARAASPAVARVRAITPRFDPIALADDPDLAVAGAGSVLLLVVTAGPELPPAPSLGLLRDVEAYLRERAATSSRVRVAGPDWAEVRVERLVVVPAALEGQEALRERVRRALDAFLHPLTGGFEGAGWGFGQRPEVSDIYRLAMGVPGVDGVRELSLHVDAIDPARAERVLIYPGPHLVELAPLEALV